VDRLILDGVGLQVARDDAVLLPVDVDIDDGRGEVTLDDLLPQVVVVEDDGQRRFAVAIDDSRNFSFTTCLACGPLAGTRARRSLERNKPRHGIVSGF